MTEQNLGASTPGKKQNQDGMFRCDDCGRLYPEAEMWELNQCQMCWEAACDAAWWEAVSACL